LKKQSQFSGGQIGANSYLKGNYGNKPACRAQKNKANFIVLSSADSVWIPAFAGMTNMETLHGGKS